METASNPRLRHPTDTGKTPVKPKPNKRKAPAPYDGRYAIGRRVRQLIAEFRRRLEAKADDVVMQAAIRRAAETTALAESLRAKMLRGEPVSPDDTLRMSRAADLMTRRLHLDRHQPQQQSGLAAYLRSHHNDEAGP